jgi:hypothetical protein
MYRLPACVTSIRYSGRGRADSGGRDQGLLDSLAKPGPDRSAADWAKSLERRGLVTKRAHANLSSMAKTHPLAAVVPDLRRCASPAPRSPAGVATACRLLERALMGTFQAIVMTIVMTIVKSTSPVGGRRPRGETAFDLEFKTTRPGEDPARLPLTSQGSQNLHPCKSRSAQGDCNVWMASAKAASERLRQEANRARVLARRA